MFHEYVHFCGKLQTMSQMGKKKKISLLGLNIFRCLLLSENEPLWQVGFFSPGNLEELSAGAFHQVKYAMFSLIYGNKADIYLSDLHLCLEIANTNKNMANIVQCQHVPIILNLAQMTVVGLHRHFERNISWAVTANTNVFSYQAHFMHNIPV